VVLPASKASLRKITMTSRSTNDLRRGEVWLIRFDPTQGAEIGKTRPAVVVNPGSVGRLPMRIVGPVTGWQRKYCWKARGD
jgi:hypothetical protein